MIDAVIFLKVFIEHKLNAFRFRQPIVRLYRAAIPFVILAVVALVAVTYIEPISTFTAPQPTATATGDGKPGRRP